MSKKSSNKAFIDKIKTLTIGTGAKDTKCGNCGQPLSEHELKLVGIGLIPIPMPPTKKKEKPEAPKHEETSFAA